MKKCFFFFLFVFLLVHHKTYAQGFIWAQAFQGINLSKMLVDDSDNIYTVGSFKDSVDIDPNASVQMLYAVGKSNMVIAKQDSAGNLLWAKQIKGRVWAPSSTNIYTSVFTNDKAGNLYVMGYFTDSFDFDPGPNDFWLGSATNDYIFFILKLSPNGDFVWAKSYHATGNILSITGLVVRDNSIYVSATINGTADIDPGPDTVNATPAFAPNASILEKLDTAGHFHWYKQVNGANYLGRIIMDSSANIFAYGGFNNVIDFDPGLGTAMATAPANSYDLFIEKFDSSGNYQWAKIITSSSLNFHHYDWKFDNKNDLIIIGTFSGTIDFDFGPGTYFLSPSNMNEPFTLKLNDNGDFKWVKPNNGGQFFTSDTLGNIYCLGGGGSNILYAEKMDSSGNHKWTVSYNGGGLGSILLNHSNKLYTLGSFQGNNVDLDPTIGVNAFSSTSGASFIQKLCIDSNPLSLTTDTNYACYTLPAHLTATYYPSATYDWLKDGVYVGSTATNTRAVFSGGNYGVEINGLGCTSVSDTTIKITSIAPVVMYVTFTTTNPLFLQVGHQYHLDVNISYGNIGPPQYTLVWGRNGVPFDTIISSSWGATILWTKLAGGNDTITATAYFPCTSPITDTLIIIAPNAVSEIPKESNLTLFPNPAKDQITIQYTQAGSIILMDIAGRQLGVYTLATGKKTETIDISSLAKGVYLLRFSSNDGAVETVKVVKE